MRRKILAWLTLPHQVKSQYMGCICISDFMQTTFFYLGRFLTKLADDQCSSITKGSIYHIKHMYIHPFTTVVDWLEIGSLMEVSAMFYICRYCVFAWNGRTIVQRAWYYDKHVKARDVGVDVWETKTFFALYDPSLYRRWAGKTSYVHLAPEHVLTMKHLRRTERN